MPIKICAIADLHGHLPEIPECDLLLIAGDISPLQNHELFFQKIWLDSNWRDYLAQLNCEVVWIAGNHDFIFQEAPEVIKDMNLPGHYLQDSSISLNIKGVSLNIYGTPWTPWFLSWAFNAYEENLENSEALPYEYRDMVTKTPRLEDIFNKIPEDTDILISHGPVYGFNDGLMTGQRAGSKALGNRILELPKLKYIVSGHLHSNFGLEFMRSVAINEDKISCHRTYSVGCSIVDEKYRMCRKPLVFNYE